ncbi:MAG: glycosyltransferase family 2 protein, partial [bacterium]
MLEISVIIPTFQKPAILYRVLENLTRQTLPKDNFEIIVIDDDASFDIESMVTGFSARFKNLHYHKQNQKGQSCARNAGVKAAKSSLIFLTGDDILLAPDVLELHIKFHSSCPHKNIAVMGNIKVDPGLMGDNFIQWLHESGVQNNFSDLRKSGFIPHFRVETAHLSVPKKYLDRVKFDENLKYYENLVWSEDLFQLGFLFYYLKEAESFHYHPTSLKEYASRYREVGRTIRYLKEPGRDFYFFRTQTVKP